MKLTAKTKRRHTDCTGLADIVIIRCGGSVSPQKSLKEVQSFSETTNLKNKRTTALSSAFSAETETADLNKEKATSLSSANSAETESAHIINKKAKEFWALQTPQKDPDMFYLSNCQSPFAT